MQTELHNWSFTAANWKNFAWGAKIWHSQESAIDFLLIPLEYIREWVSDWVSEYLRPLLVEESEGLLKGNSWQGVWSIGGWKLGRHNLYWS